MSEYVVRVTGLVPDAIYERAVEEIVRCRDCKFYDEDDGYGNYGCTLLDFGTKDMADGFCSWGERK